MVETVEACSWTDVWLYKVYDLSACESFWFVPEDMAEAGEVDYK